MSTRKKELPTPELRTSPGVPLGWIVCKVKGCVKIHDDYYPMCGKHREERKDVEDGAS